MDFIHRRDPKNWSGVYSRFMDQEIGGHTMALGVPARIVCLLIDCSGGYIQRCTSACNLHLSA